MLWSYATFGFVLDTRPRNLLLVYRLNFGLSAHFFVFVFSKVKSTLRVKSKSECELI